MTDWRTTPRTGRWRERLRAIFPERQILIRNQGRIHCFHIGSVQQIALLGAIGGCVLWSLAATAAYVDGLFTLAGKDSEIAQRTAELDGVKANYRATFGQLDEFQTIFSGITCEIADIQDSLLKITERTVGSGKHSGSQPAGMPRLNPAGSGCALAQDAVAGEAAAGEKQETKRIVGTLKDSTAKETLPNDQEVLRRRVAHLEEELARLKASHGAFLEQSAGLAAVRIGQLEKALTSVGVDTKAMTVSRQRHGRPTEEERGTFGQGGPFIAAHGGIAPRDNFNPVTLFNSHADRLENLTTTVRALTIGEPLVDYDVTSPFGARNDPINGLTGIHEGVDLGAPTGTPVLSTGEGQVTTASWRDRYGLLVEVEHGMNIHTRYAHLSKVLVNVGQHVVRGTPLGLVGETGRTTGPHLHYEVRVGDQATNPMKFIMAGQNVLKGQ